jgi:hypothetical protein
VALLRDLMTRGGLEAVELRGERPDTEIVLRFREPGRTGGRDPTCIASSLEVGISNEWRRRVGIPAGSGLGRRLDLL